MAFGFFYMLGQLRLRAHNRVQLPADLAGDRPLAATIRVPTIADNFHFGAL